LDRYQEQGAVRFAENRSKAKDELIRKWSDCRATHAAGKSSLILAHSRADVARLNHRAREVLKERGELGGEVRVETRREVAREDGTIAVECGERSFASGDRLMFLKNDRELGVKNGTLGTISEVGRGSMRVVLDGKEPRAVRLDLRNYAALDYGYAATVHKAQGATVDRVFILASPGMDRHLAYVGMTRHREEAMLYAGRDDFNDFDALKERLSRARPKDSTLDYATRRGIEPAVEQTRMEAAPGCERDIRAPRQAERDPIDRFKVPQRKFIKLAGNFDLDLDAKWRAAELRQEMKEAAHEIAKDAALMRRAEHAGIASQVKSLGRQVESESSLRKEWDFGMEL
jgi:UvrD-like helicase family protein